MKRTFPIILVLAFIWKGLCLEINAAETNLPRFVDLEEMQAILKEAEKKKAVFDFLASKLKEDETDEILFMWKQNVFSAVSQTDEIFPRFYGFIKDIEGLIKRIENFEKLTGKDISDLSKGSEKERIATYILVGSLRSSLMEIAQNCDSLFHEYHVVVATLHYDFDNDTALIAPKAFRDDLLESLPTDEVLKLGRQANQAWGELSVLRIMAGWDIFDRVTNSAIDGGK